MYLGKWEIGKVVRRMRLERNLTIEDLAEQMGREVKFLQELEDEMHPDVTLGIYYKFAEVFGLEGPEFLQIVADENVDYTNRIFAHPNSHMSVLLKKDDQRKRLRQKKRTSNFKSKHTKQSIKYKTPKTDNRPTTSIRKLNELYELY